MPSDDGHEDLRSEPPGEADERTTLSAFLDYQRETLALKCAGLTPLQLKRWAVPPSSLSLLGLVRHLAEVEQSWFRCVLLGEAYTPHWTGPRKPRGAQGAHGVQGAQGVRGAALEARASLESPEARSVLGEGSAQWDVDDADVDEAFRVWRAECDRSRAAVAAADSLDVTGSHDGRTYSLRYILTHLVEEYARHNGHADLLRERIDGATGQ